MENEVKKDSSQENNSQPIESTPIELPVETREENQIIQQDNTPKKDTISNIIGKLKSFGMSKVIVIAVVVVLLLGLGIFKISTSTPKYVFKSAINSLYKEGSKTLKDFDKFSEKFDIENSPVIFNITSKIDTNVENIKESMSEEEIDLKDLEITAKTGFDLDKKEMMMGGALKGKSEEINFEMLVNEKEAYLDSNLLNKPIKGDITSKIDFDEFVALNKNLPEVDYEIYDKMLKSLTNAVNKSLDPDCMEKESDEIDVLGKDLKVTKYSYEIDDSAMSDIIRETVSQLLEDDEFISNVKDTFDVDKSDVKDTLKEIKSDAKDIKFDGKFVINIYTRGVLNSFAGISLEVEKDEYFTYYTDGKNIELNIDNNVEGYSQSKMKIEAEKDGEEMNVTVEYNDEEIATATVRELSDEKIDFDFEITDKDTENVKGKIYITFKEEKESISGDYELKAEVDKEYVSFKGNYNLEKTTKLSEIDTASAIDEDELDEEEVFDNFKKIAEKDKTFTSIYESAYSTYEEENLNLNYYDMAMLYSIDEVKELFNKSKGIVLFVSPSYYDYGNYSDTSMSHNLIDAQDEYNFHTYYYSSYYVNDEFRTLVKDVQPVCTPSSTTTTETTCTEFPTIYFIKDGKVVAAVQNAISKEDLEKHLKEIGLI